MKERLQFFWTAPQYEEARVLITLGTMVVLTVVAAARYFG